MPYFTATFSNFFKKINFRKKTISRPVSRCGFLSAIISVENFVQSSKIHGTSVRHMTSLPSRNARRISVWTYSAPMSCESGIMRQGISCFSLRSIVLTWSTIKINFSLQQNGQRRSSSRFIWNNTGFLFVSRLQDGHLYSFYHLYKRISKYSNFDEQNVDFQPILWKKKRTKSLVIMVKTIIKTSFYGFFCFCQLNRTDKA